MSIYAYNTVTDTVLQRIIIIATVLVLVPASTTTKEQYSTWVLGYIYFTTTITNVTTTVEVLRCNITN